ncbi:hypothetical protein V1264_007857 [Littorina saxatilis]|uniref:Reverse transcriptase domain-containing protein n=1 Tax=Littorina saxatilis TaxID=31220 RepID=A0AAN9G473_9CAEN
METLVREAVNDHLRSNNLICENQHGFVQGRSCVTHLLEALDDWTKILDEGGSVDIVYMDFMKAFDTVPHARLIAKVEAHGIHGNVLNWIRNFLADRHQQVIVNGTHSDKAPVTSGIPQGSVLGPLLFTLYINDLPSQVTSSVKLFADDTKLYTRTDVPSGPVVMQEDLDNLQEWSDNWLLKFHPKKCSVLKLGKQHTETSYHMKGRSESGEEVSITLEESETEKDLGVLVDNRLSFKGHVAQATAKANKTIGIIRRSFEHLDREVFVQLYKSLVRPILEYGHSVWQPQQKLLCKEIEDVQRRATKLISALSEKTYPERLAILKLPSLEHRRLRGDMIDLYKYMHGIYDTGNPNFQLAETKDTRGNSLKLYKPFCRLNVRSCFFAERVIPHWNSLPETVVTAPSVNSFKGRLDNFWADRPEKFSPTCYQ